MKINDYFDGVYCINLPSRADRRKHAEEQFNKHGLNVRFCDGIPGDSFRDIRGGDTDYDRGFRGNMGCTASHRAILDMIAREGCHRGLVFEDDVEFVTDDLQRDFAAWISEVPQDWQMLYLGGSFQEDPLYRVSAHVVRTRDMMTTSSYAVTGAAAKHIAPHVCGVGPIDSIYQQFNRELPTYIFTPRLAVQYENMSDIQSRVMNNSMSMLDAGHLNRLDKKT